MSEPERPSLVLKRLLDEEDEAYIELARAHERVLEITNRINAAIEAIRSQE